LKRGGTHHDKKRRKDEAEPHAPTPQNSHTPTVESEKRLCRDRFRVKQTGVALDSRPLVLCRAASLASSFFHDYPYLWRTIGIFGRSGTDSASKGGGDTWSTPTQIAEVTLLSTALHKTNVGVSNIPVIGVDNSNGVDMHDVVGGSGCTNFVGGRQKMEWTTPQFEEVVLNCEINSYANAAL
jgi:hypothetical protein